MGIAVFGVISGLWSVFTAVLVGRYASSMRVALVSVACLLAVVGVALGLIASLGRMLPEFLIVFAGQSLVAVAATAAAARSRAGLRGDPVWAGFAAGLLGGLVVLLWHRGHTGRGVLVLGAVLVVVAVGVLVRHAWHALVVVPLAATVAIALAPVYALVPAAVDRWFPVLAG
jgi:hypothetical protein